MSKKRMNKITPEPIKLVATQGEPIAISPIQAAMQAGASPSELLQFMELQERHEANEARKAFVAAMANFRASCPTIKKTEEAHNSMYASIAGTLNQIKGLMSENGLSHSWRTSQEGKDITVSCVVTHALGHSEQTSLTAAPDTSGSKNAIQAIGSTVKYLERYTLEACLGLSSSLEGDDDGGAFVERLSSDQLIEIDAYLTDNGFEKDNIGRFERYACRVTGAKDMSDIRGTEFDFVMKLASDAVKMKQEKDKQDDNS